MANTQNYNLDSKIENSLYIWNKNLRELQAENNSRSTHKYQPW